MNIKRRLARRLHALGWQIAERAAPLYGIHTRGLRLRLVCNGPMHYYRCVTFEDKEPETLDWLDRQLDPGDTLFDVGANIGGYSIYAALRQPAARVVAIEPEYANMAVLRDNLFANEVQDRVTTYSVALGETTRPGLLHIQDLTPGAALHTESSIALSVTRTGRPVVWSEGVMVVDLDELCAATGFSPTLMKIDVDGTEPEILRGASRTLRSAGLRSILIERPPTVDAAAECEQHLAEAGFRRRVRADEAGENEVWERDAP